MKANPDYRKFCQKILAPPFQKLNAMGKKVCACWGTESTVPELD